MWLEVHMATGHGELPTHTGAHTLALSIHTSEGKGTQGGEPCVHSGLWLFVNNVVYANVTSWLPCGI